MKNLREELKNELKSRLRSYREEPEEELWAQIAPHISEKSSLSGLWQWIERLSLVLLVITLLFPVLNQHKNRFHESALTVTPKSPLPESKTNIGVNTTVDELKQRKSIPKSKSDISSGAFAVKTENASAQSSASVLDSNGKQPEHLVPASQRDSVQINAEDVTASAISIAAGSSSDPILQEREVNSSISLTVENVMVNKKESAAKEVKPAKEKSTERIPKRFTTYITLMPTFGYQRVESNDQDNIIIESIKRIPAFSTSRLGIRAEIGLETRSDKKLRVFGGLLYYQRKQTIDYTEKTLDSTIMNPGSSGVVLEPHFKYSDKSFEYELKNIGVQIGVNYLLSQRKFSHTIGTGIEFQIALNRLDNEQSMEFTSTPSAYVFYNLYYRLQYPADGRLKAIFQPTLNYSFYINENFNAPFYVKPYGLGLNLGATYNF